MMTMRCSIGPRAVEIHQKLSENFSSKMSGIQNQQVTHFYGVIAGCGEHAAKREVSNPDNDVRYR